MSRPSTKLARPSRSRPATTCAEVSRKPSGRQHDRAARADRDASAARRPQNPQAGDARREPLDDASDRPRVRVKRLYLAGQLSAVGCRGVGRAIGRIRRDREDLRAQLRIPGSTGWLRFIHNTIGSITIASWDRYGDVAAQVPPSLKAELLLEVTVKRVPQALAGPVATAPSVFSGKPFEYRHRLPGCAVGLVFVPPEQPGGTDTGPAT